MTQSMLILPPNTRLQADRQMGTRHILLITWGDLRISPILLTPLVTIAHRSLWGEPAGWGGRNGATFTSPRAWAFCLIGIHEYLRRLSGDRLVQQISEGLRARLMDIFESASHPDWLWFEEKLSYDNAKLAHALILSGRVKGHQ